MSHDIYEELKHMTRIMDGKRAEMLHEIRCGGGVREFLKHRLRAVISSEPPFTGVPLIDDKDVPFGEADLVFGDGYKRRAKLITSDAPATTPLISEPDSASNENSTKRPKA